MILGTPSSLLAGSTAPSSEFFSFGYVGDTLGYYKGMIVATTMTFMGIILG